MKSIRLALQQISAMFSRQKFLFILFSIGVTLCSLVLTYYWGSGNFAHSMETPEYNTEVSTYEIGFSNPTMQPQDVLDKEAIAKLEQADFPIPVQEFIYMSYINPDTISGVEITDTFWDWYSGPSDDPWVYVYSYRNNTDKKQASAGRVDFTEEELSAGARVVVVPEDLFPAFDQGSPPTITLRGIPFEVIGTKPVTQSCQCFGIPYQAMVQEDFPISCIRFTLSRTPTFGENDEITAILEELFPENVSIDTPLFFISMLGDSTIHSMSISVALYFVAFLTMMFLMKYLLDQSRHEMVVYSVVGASKKRALLVLLLQNSLLVLFSGLVAFALFFALKQPLFALFAPSPDYRYTAVDLISILLLELVLSFLIALPFLLHFIRKTPVQLKNTAG